ncbi:hypothetical protein CPAV1605_1130 [seawater metagenome]|uniref:Uncharacterized protein n=1 Tax=seawater metagenome TaxID=1561972 RepID=A0A5E8CKW1_9ZZZZ
MNYKTFNEKKLLGDALPQYNKEVSKKKSKSIKELKKEMITSCIVIFSFVICAIIFSFSIYFLLNQHP